MKTQNKIFNFSIAAILVTTLFLPHFVLAAEETSGESSTGSSPTESSTSETSSSESSSQSSESSSSNSSESSSTESSTTESSNSETSQTQSTETQSTEQSTSTETSATETTETNTPANQSSVETESNSNSISETTASSTSETVETTQSTTTSTSTEVVTESLSSSESSTAVANEVRLTIRLNESIIYSATTTISADTIVVTDNTGTTANIAQNIVLGMLTAADANSETFTVTDLAFFASFNSYIINCISTGATPSCYNWQYTVNDVYPFVGIDDYILNNGDDVYLYFGTQNRFSVTDNTISLTEPISVTAEKYEYRTNSWAARANVTVGATQPNPADPWTPTVVTSTLTNSLGQASLYVTATGTYNVGIGDDYYYPTEAVTVSEIITTTSSTTNTTTSTESTANTGGTGGGSTTNENTTATFDVTAAGNFLFTKQNSDGSIGSASLYSDWAAMAIGSLGNSSAKAGLITYLKTNPNAGTTATDYERRAMALLALGLNPYTDTPTNYIAEIMKKYDGTQFGDAGLVNDDIFALFPLLKSGYSTGDAEIQKAVTFILSKQNTVGGWESPDLTAAAVQALAQVKSLDGVNDSLSRAKNYLKVSTKTDGRIGDNAFSTGWGLQALSALGESATTWNGSNPSPLNFLATQQKTDGGVNPTTDSNDNRIWATSYAIPGAQGKTWDSILIAVPKFTIINSIGNGVTGNTVTTTNSTVVTSTSQTATTTPQITTSTTQFVTTTPEIVVPIAIPVQEPVVDQTQLVTEIPITNNSETNPTSPQPIRTIQTVGTNNETKPLETTQNPEPTATGEQLSAPGPQIPASGSNKALFGGAAALAGTAGAYLAWRFLQGLV